MSENKPEPTRFVQLVDDFDPERQCGLCGAPLKAEGECDDEADRIGATAAIVVLHLHTQTPFKMTRPIRKAIRELLKEGLIYKTANNGPVPYGHSAAADEACRVISRMVWPDL